MTILDDDAFLAAVSAGERPGGRFDHLDHLRLAWIVVRRDGPTRGEHHVAHLLRHLATSQGAAARYHETMTRAWVRLVAAALRHEPDDVGFEALLAARPELTQRSLLERHFSAELLATPRARASWVEPDRTPLPLTLPRASRRIRRPARERRLRMAFLVGAATDALALIPLLVPAMSFLLWGFADRTAADRFAMGYAASLMLAWTALLLWAARRPLQRAFVAPLTVLAIYGLVATELAAIVRGDVALWRMIPTLVLQGGLLWLFASAYHGWRLRGPGAAPA